MNCQNEIKFPSEIPKSISQWTFHWAKARGFHCTYYPVTDSSNSRARECISSLPESFHLFVAGKQTSGRGQKENVWLNSDLMASWLWKKKNSSKKLPLPSDFISDLQHTMTSLWPNLPAKSSKTNDLFLGETKVAGLLLEVIDQPPCQALILGLGMNVFSHPENVSAGHLMEHLDSLSIKEWCGFLDLLHSTWSQTANL